MVNPEHLRIVSRGCAPFRDRTEAGTLLGEELTALRKEEPVVLGIPRGGLIVARSLASVLNAPLDAIFAIKVGFPGNPELAVGALSEGGGRFFNTAFIERMGISGAVEREAAARSAELLRRTELIRRHLPRIPLSGRTVIVVDDGVATGSTTRAALRAVRSSAPRRLIGAVPVGEEGAVEILAEETDEMICLRCPPDFRAVSQFYRSFPQLSDEEVESLLRSRPPGGNVSPPGASTEREGG